MAIDLYNTPTSVRVNQGEAIVFTEAEFLTNVRSFNNRLIVSVYVKQALRSDNSSGFAFIEQKAQVVGLKVLVQAKLADGTIIPVGATAFIKEEVLHSAPWAQKVFKSDALQESFLIVDMNQVEFINPQESV